MLVLLYLIAYLDKTNIGEYLESWCGGVANGW